MTTAQPQSVAGSADYQSIVDWLLEKVAFYLEVPVTGIEPTGKLVEYGLDSVYALALVGDIEDEYEIEVEPTLAWDHPTVAAIAGLVRDLIAESRTAS
ncbi:acyl carrier protein [Streptomyces sp. NPDC023588]|uniref:acyl carrier protein n=1 Tax=Streptomyces sp. NPDC023588 TaxID=3154907 RepID=UPI0033EB1970